MNPISEGMIGAVRAVWWAASFYVIHAWPVAVLVAVPALVRMAATVRGSYSSSENVPSTFDLFPVLLRVTLFLVVASIDMSPAGPWWQSLWPGEWTPTLAARVASMSGRVDVWIWMGLGVALATLVIVGLVKLLTLPVALKFVFQRFGARPANAARWADALGLGASGLVTLPLTSLTLYAAVARPGYCLHP